MGKIFWDLDGCLRSLTDACTYNPQSWDEPCHGMSLIDWVDQNLDLLVSATPTEYWHLVVEKGITILTVQPLHWIPWTELWIKKHLPLADVKYCKKPLDKLEYLTNGSLLVEDYPNFPDNSKIIMIDKVYNHVIQSFKRVSTPQELEVILNEHKT